MRGHYKSWSGMKKGRSRLCALRSRSGLPISTPPITRCTTPRTGGGAAGRQRRGLFSWIETYRQERDIAEFLSSRPVPNLEVPGDEFYENKSLFGTPTAYTAVGLLDALHRFLSLPIEDALASDDLLLRFSPSSIGGWAGGGWKHQAAGTWGYKLGEDFLL